MVSTFEKKKGGGYIGPVYVEFKNKTRFGFLIPIFELVIKKVVANDKRLHHFNQLVFVLEDEQEYIAKKRRARLREMMVSKHSHLDMAFVLDQEVKVESEEFHITYAKVHIVVDTILLDTILKYAPWIVKRVDKDLMPVNVKTEQEIIQLANSYLEDELPETVTHELTHAIHHLRDTLRIRWRRIERISDLTSLRIIKNVSKTEDLGYAFEYSQFVASFREIIEWFLYDVYAEGLATYFAKIIYDDDFIYMSKDDKFATLYSNAYNHSSQFFTDLEKFISDLRRERMADDKYKAELNNILDQFDYNHRILREPFGFHMVFTIIHAQYDEDELFDLSIAEFIKLYEMACEQRNVQPLISLTSGKGKLFNYKKMLDVDLTAIKGTGPDGRITEEDVKNSVDIKKTVAAPKPAFKKTKKYDFFGYVDHVPLKGIKKITAEKMMKAVTNSALLTHHDHVDVTELSQVRKKEKEKAAKKKIHLTYLPFIIKATLKAIKKHPFVASSVEGDEIIVKKYYNIGVAIDTPDGLIVPVIKGADQKKLYDLANEVNNYVEKAKTRKIDLMDLKGGVFTITNIGVIGSTYFTPIVNYPESGILGTGRIEDQAKVVDGKIVIRKVMPISFTYDHRVLDGAEAARFMNDLKELLEKPNSLVD